HWPGVIKPGALSKEVGHVIDLLPTCLDLAGVVYPEQYEGRSLRPVLEGGTREAHERLCWEHYGNRAIRQEHWKLVAPKDGPWELYDLEADRTELNNLIDHEPGRAQSMMSEYEKWAAKCGVQ
ncbi:MAG: DUF4976 domain-containing protein, partial [Candidatus Hydrogenedentes bacterium]|nr:DUF4976 domain-containing protein [Candidatus Hydrogenedentota bacterium]